MLNPLISGSKSRETTILYPCPLALNSVFMLSVSSLGGQYVGLSLMYLYECFIVISGRKIENSINVSVMKYQNILVIPVDNANLQFVHNYSDSSLYHYTMVADQYIRLCVLYALLFLNENFNKSSFSNVFRFLIRSLFFFQ